MNPRTGSARALLRLPVNRKVTGILEGAYVALHPGRSTEFVDVREYVPGDDPKDIDWKASARARALYVRRHHAHRKLTVLLVVSTARSMAAAADGGTAKRDVAAAVAGVVGSIAVAHGDLVGIVHGDADTQVTLRARGGSAHLDRCLATAYDASTPSSGASDLATLLRHVERSVRRSSLLVVVTDDVTLGPDASRRLAGLRDRHDLLLVVVPGVDPLRVDPAEHPVLTDVDSAVPLPSWLRDDPSLAAEHTERVARDRADLDRGLGTLGLAHVHIAGIEETVPGLARLFDGHRRAGRR